MPSAGQTKALAKAPVKILSEKQKQEIEARGENKQAPHRKLPNTRLRNFTSFLWFAVQLVLFPLWPVFISLAARDPYYATRYFQTMWHCVRTFRNTVRNGSLMRIFKYNVLMSPAEVEHALSIRQGACTRCAKCCKMLQCTYLAYDKGSKQYYCQVFNSKYWIFGSCGRFPLDQQDIDDYNCPGFSFPPAQEAAAAPAPRPQIVQIGKLKN